MLDLARYRVVRRLGAGAAGGVYLVEDQVLAGPPMALKRLEGGSDPSFRDSLAREFAVLASIAVPRVARVYDLGSLPGQGELPAGTYFTRSFIDGVPLTEYVVGRPQRERLAVFVTALRTVAQLHQVGVVHGDLKPANIIVDPRGCPHLIDFGLSFRLVEASSSMSADGLGGSGTPLYMAPELLRGAAPSVASDIFALGATLWELLTGLPPHAALRSRALGARLSGEPAQLPPEIDVDRRLVELAHWAMASELRERAPRVDELVARLEQLQLVAPAQPSTEDASLFAAPRIRGRDALLSELLELSRQPGSSLTLLSGESGLGKSAVLRALKWRLQLEGMRVVEVHCRGGGLSPLVQLLRQLRVVSQDEHRALLGALQEGTALRNELVAGALDMLVASAQAAPLVVVADDIDEAEPVFAEVLRLALYADVPTQLSIVATATQLDTRSIGELGPVRVLALKALSGEQIDALISELLGPTDTRGKEALLRRAQGNPGVLVELASSLGGAAFTSSDVERLQVGSVGDRLARGRAAALSTPQRQLLALLSAATGALPERAACSVIPALDEHGLAALGRAGLVRREQESVTLEEPPLGMALRAQLGEGELQRLAARLLSSHREELGPVTRAELLIIASEAPVPVTSILAGADLLQRQGALSSAAALVERSLDVVATCDRKQLVLRLAELYAESGEAKRAHQQAITLLQEENLQPEERADALICAATSLVSIGDLEPAAQLLEQIPVNVSGATRAKAARVFARLLLRRGEHGRVQEVVAEAVRSAEPADASLPELLAIDAYVLALRGRNADAEPLYERALTLAKKLGLRRDAAQVLGYRALGYEREGNLEKALREYERCLEAARDAGDVGLTATYALNRGNVSYRKGDWGAAEQSFELSARLARRAGRTGTALLASNNLADVHLYLGSYARAEQLAEATLRQARELGSEVAEAQATHLLGSLSARTGPLEKALSDFERASSLYLKVGRPREAAEVLLDAADALLNAGGTSNVSLASARLAAARELIERHDIDDFRTRLKLLVAVVRARNGHLSEALQELESLESQLLFPDQRELRWQLLWAQASVYEALGSDMLAGKRARDARDILESIAARIPRDVREAFRSDPRRRRVLELAQSKSQHEQTSRTGIALSTELDPRTTRLLELLKRLARERDEARLLERITDAAVELSGAERGFVLLVDATGQLAPHTVREGRGVEQDPHVAFSRSIAEAVLIDGEPIITVNARDDARVNDFMSVHKLLLKSVACIPINGPRGVLGVLYLEHRMRAGRFREADIDLLVAFADQAAIALENAALWAENERSKVALEEKNRELLSAKEEIERLLEARTEELEEAKRALHRARRELETRYQQHGIIGQSQAMQRVFAMIERVADSALPVVIHGESGTGKELVARAIHAASPRRKAPFVAVNCAAVPDQLLESELFGHLRGAFTGAERDRKGLFAQAHGGTLFLDEFADMSPRMQIDLLRVLQEGRIKPVGADSDVAVDVRVLVASTRALEKLVSERLLREDLYYRLSVVEIKLPPLRERRDDIPLLCQHFLSRIGGPKRDKPLTLSRAALQRISASELPGNVRQLEHLLTSAAMMAESNVIDVQDLPSELRDEVASAPPAREQSDSSASAEPTPADLHSFKEREKQRILAALDKCAWNRAKAATILGMPRRTFYRRLTEFGIL